MSPFTEVDVGAADNLILTQATDAPTISEESDSEVNVGTEDDFNVTNKFPTLDDWKNDSLITLQKPTVVATHNIMAVRQTAEYCSNKGHYKYCIRMDANCNGAGCDCSFWRIDLGTGKKDVCNTCKLCAYGNYELDCTNFLGDEFGCFPCILSESSLPPSVKSFLSESSVSLKRPTNEPFVRDCNHDQINDFHICIQYNQYCATEGCNCRYWIENHKTGEIHFCKSCELCTALNYTVDCTNIYGEEDGLFPCTSSTTFQT